MKSILSASICTAALAFAIPAMAATDTPKHTHHHHMSKMGPKTHAKKAGDPTTEELNAKSLAAARGSSTPGTADTTTPAASTAAPAGAGMAPGAASGSAMGPAAAPATSTMAPAAPTGAAGAMAPTAPTSGTTSTTTPGNAPGGQ